MTLFVRKKLFLVSHGHVSGLRTVLLVFTVSPVGTMTRKPFLIESHTEDGPVGKLDTSTGKILVQNCRIGFPQQGDGKLKHQWCLIFKWWWGQGKPNSLAVTGPVFQVPYTSLNSPNEYNLPHSHGYTCC